jgi:hypothetical protein
MRRQITDVEPTRAVGLRHASVGAHAFAIPYADGGR